MFEDGLAGGRGGGGGRKREAGGIRERGEVGGRVVRAADTCKKKQLSWTPKAQLLPSSGHHHHHPSS